MERRDFLVRLGAAAGFAGSALPAPGQDRRFRVGVIGHTGRGDYGHGLDVMWLKVPGAEVVAVADADPAGLEAARGRLGGARGFARYGDMLREVRPDVVAIAPRHADQHHAMCLAAAHSGVRGLYVEKPFCRTPREADEIVEACARSRVRLAVAHRNRWHPVLHVILKLVKAGEIGRLLELRGRGKEDHRGGAQDLWVLGSHVFNLATYFGGAPGACTAVLYQDGRPCTKEQVRPADEGLGPIAGNAVHARFEMAAGVPFYFDSMQGHGDRRAGFGLQLIGTGGVIDLRIDTPQLAQIRRGNPFLPSADPAPWLPISSAGIGRPEPIEGLAGRVAGHLLGAEHLLSCVETNSAPLCDAEAGRTIIEMICAVFESHLRLGARVTLPLKKRDHPFGP